MGWFSPKNTNTMATTVSSTSPNFHLVVIFGIVFSLLWLSNYTVIYLQFLLMLSPILAILLFISYATTFGRLNFSFMRFKNVASHRM
ncbi:hypothetical protein VIGAN_06081400 [Vigna angularis var. angularis]|uniref:Uncharacterized protein n=1 Tax=Vigna angularis var. angularis TaxID=157739 RepID=A0A0S3SAA2_PHAAN|nr:hypothetical protein VIGAN_06081400 [Vigna angularis var. angularis]